MSATVDVTFHRVPLSCTYHRGENGLVLERVQDAEAVPGCGTDLLPLFKHVYVLTPEGHEPFSHQVLYRLAEELGE